MKPTDEKGRDIVKSVPSLPMRDLDEIYTTTSTSTSRYWKMNFGLSGKYDDVDYSTAESSVWTAGADEFQYDKHIIHNFKF